MNSQSLAAEAAIWRNTSSGTRWEQFRDSGLLDSGLTFADSPFQRWPLQISALLALSVLAGALVLVGPLHHPSRLRTATGEQRSLTLADGSVIDLNSDSDARIAFTAQERRVILAHGEARFTVASEPGRPFLVSTPQATVKSSGTAFKVRSGAKETALTVLEGRVAILPPLIDEIPGAPAAIPQMLFTGERASVTRTGEIRVQHNASAKFGT